MSRTPSHRPTTHDRPLAARPTRRRPGGLPRWLRRGLRAWARRARRWASGPSRATWVVLESPLEGEPGQEGDERRCGWFDSSQDLREGLCVSEHQSGDAVCAQLPVMAWVQLQLSGWRPNLEPTLR